MMRIFIIMLVRIYQRSLSPVLAAAGCQCRFHPHCSEYAVQVVRELPLCQALWLCLRRLLSCQPLHPGGFDYPPKGIYHVSR